MLLLLKYIFSWKMYPLDSYIKLQLILPIGNNAYLHRWFFWDSIEAVVKITCVDLEGSSILCCTISRNIRFMIRRAINHSHHSDVEVHSHSVDGGQAKKA